MRYAVFIAFALAFCGPLAWAQTRPAPPPASAPASNQLELNSASRDALMTLDGIGEVRADAIIRARPFKAKTELVERRLIPEALYEKISDKVFARPPPPAPPPPKPAPAAPAKRG
ncbi:ComEA family DNA-binding protein [Reyranella sp.]|uniref:ComEA family DNA-binding protein n=1 Tax=Reyranella sp. TaxID=1929291 RepID=UPI003D0FC7F0